MESQRSAQRALLILLIGSVILVALVFRPLAMALFLAAVLAGFLWPTHNWLTSRLGGRPKVSAFLILLLVVVLIVGPLAGLSAFLVKEATDAAAWVNSVLRSEGVEGLLTRLPDLIEKPVRSGLSRLNLTDGASLAAMFSERVSPGAGTGAAAAVGSVLATTGSVLFQTAMMLIALFVFLTQKEAALSWIDRASPLRSGQTRELLAEFHRVTVAVVRSSVLTALVQASAALVGFYIARVPHPVFFGAVTFFFALIPAIGGAVVCVLAALLLLVTGHPIAAIFLASWGVIVVGLSDNIVKPWLIKGGVEMNGAVVFFALLGGLAAFGPIGLLLGPLAVSLFVALLRIYRRDYGDKGPPGNAPTVDRRSAERVLGGTPRPRTT